MRMKMRFSKLFSTLFLINLFSIFNKNVFCQYQSENITEVINSWKKFNEHLNIDLDFLTSGFASNFETIAKQANISNECYQSFRKILTDAKSKKAYALKMLGAWGKLPTIELLDGTVSDFGFFDACMKINEIETHYCTIDFKIRLPTRKRFQSVTIPLKEITDAFQNQSDYFISKLAGIAHYIYYGRFASTGICLPSACTKEDVNKTVQVVGDRLHLIGQFSECISEESTKPKLDIYQICSVIFFVILILLAITGTSIDYFRLHSEQNKYHKYLSAFSVRRNFHSLFKISNSSGELKCLNGLRVLTMIWIIIGHSAERLNHNAFQSVFNLADTVTTVEIQWLVNATYSVETFFVMSGILTSYVTMLITKGDEKKFNAFAYVSLRYLRLLPGLLAAMAGTFFLPFTGSGPLFMQTMKPIVQNCYDYWWVNLFFAQNYLLFSEICIFPTWWLAADYQFSLIALFAILLYFRKKVYSVIYMCGVLFLSTLIIIYIYINTDLPPAHVPSILLSDEMVNEFLTVAYSRTFVHTGPYLIGLSLGFIIAKRKFICNSKITYIIGWITALIMLFATLESVHFWNNGEQWSNFTATVNACTARSVWALGVAWIVYACCAGYGGPIGAFLSWDGFAIPARMTYMTFLTHMWVLAYYMATRKSLINADVSSILYMLISNVVISYLFGFVFTILCESPFLSLQKMLFAEHKSHQTRILDENKNELNLLNDNNNNNNDNNDRTKVTNNVDDIEK